MEKDDKQIDTSSVPYKIFETFLEELKKDNISKEVVDRLRDLIIDKALFSDKEIDKALFS